MKYWLLLLILLSFVASANKIVMHDFTLELPDDLEVLAQYGRITASSPDYKTSVIIDARGTFVNKFDSEVERINDLLEGNNAQLIEKECGEDCFSLSGVSIIDCFGICYLSTPSGITKTKEDFMYTYYYLAKTSRITFIIIVTVYRPINSGMLEITNMANQILESSK